MVRALLSEAYAITGVAPAGLAWSCDLDHLPSPKTIISRNGIGQLNTWKLCFLQTTMKKLVVDVRVERGPNEAQNALFFQ
jgi:hypothetical protein